MSGPTTAQSWPDATQTSLSLFSPNGKTHLRAKAAWRPNPDIFVPRLSREFAKTVVILTERAMMRMWYAVASGST
jgi:hypothetical protein